MIYQVIIKHGPMAASSVPPLKLFVHCMCIVCFIKCCL